MKSISKAVLRLSDIYISEKGSPEIWEDKDLKEAYLHYFLPLNKERAKAVLNWAKEVGFTDLFSRVVEFGSGPGTLQLAAHEVGLNYKWDCIEASDKAIETHKALTQQNKIQAPSFHQSFPQSTDAVFASSYVLNETELPEQAYNYPSILIIEPSTQSAARKLMQLRKELQNRGYYIWGPCTHQESCPLLTKSKSDWCHFRVHWSPSQSFLDLEKELPMKNKTLTLSYLLASKAKPPKFSQPSPARIIGDTLFEKGKVRQALCRGPNREFLSWLKRYGSARPYLSGQLIDLPNSHTMKGNEIRLSNNE